VRVKMPFPIGVLTGRDVYAQFGVRDPLAPQGWALSEGLQFRVCQ